MADLRIRHRMGGTLPPTQEKWRSLSHPFTVFVVGPMVFEPPTQIQQVGKFGEVSNRHQPMDLALRGPPV